MTDELAIVLGLLTIAILLFSLNKPRMDAVALMSMVALPLTGVLDVNDALAGFSDPNIVLIAALFVLGEALVRTGLAQRLGDILVRHSGKSETRLIAMLMLCVAGIGAFMSSTGVVAIFIPIVLRIAANIGTSPGRLMMPLSAAALISGMMTLVATAPNLVLDSLLRREGYPGFSFFSFTPFGIPILLFAVSYMLIARHWLGGQKHPADNIRPRLADWITSYGLAEREFRLRVEPGSPLVGKRLGALDLRATAGANILGIERWTPYGRHLIQPAADTRLQSNDVLFLDFFGQISDVTAFCNANHLERLPISGSYFSDRTQEIGMVELIVPPGSSIAGKSAAETAFRSQYGIAIVGLRREGTPVANVDAHSVLKGGDVLLAVGPWQRIRHLSRNGDFVVLALPHELDDVVEAPFRIWPATIILCLVVIAMVTGVIPNVLVALIGCLLMGLFGCIDMPSAYRSIHWQSLLVIVGMLPFSLALQKTGGVDLATNGLSSLIGQSDPRLAITIIFAATVALGLFISNTATAVLMGPIAINLAIDLDVSPYPFAMTVALASSAAFLTPVSSPVNTLVVGPGGYRFTDFTRIGIPLVLIVLIATVLLVPLALPFTSS